MLIQPRGTVKRIIHWTLVTLVIALLVFATLHGFWPFFQHWLDIHLGIGPSVPGAPYQPYSNFFGDFGSDIGEVALVGAVAGMYRKHNCHVKGCWRLSKYQVKGTTHVVCRKHHPDGHPSAEDVLKDAVLVDKTSNER
jgi:hypothetical protein